MPALARSALGVSARQLDQIHAHIAALEAELAAWHRQHPVSQRLAAVPGVGVLTATALTVALGDGTQFRSGRQFAACLGLVPRREGAGGKARLKGISKRGDAYLRSNLVHGARSSIFWHLRRDRPGAPHLQAQIAEKLINVVAVAIANRNARTAWTLVRRDQAYSPATSPSPRPPPDRAVTPHKQRLHGSRWYNRTRLQGPGQSVTSCGPQARETDWDPACAIHLGQGPAAPPVPLQVEYKNASLCPPAAFANQGASIQERRFLYGCPRPCKSPVGMHVAHNTDLRSCMRPVGAIGRLLIAGPDGVPRTGSQSVSRACSPRI